MNMENYSIDKQNGNICFNEKEHVYFDITDPSKKFISVTTLIEKFGQPFDKNFWSAYKALEKLLPKDAWAIEKKSLLTSKKFDPAILELHDISENDFNREQQGILDAWEEENKKSCERGTKIHADLEHSFYKKKKNIDISKYQIGGTFECRKDYTDLDLENAVYPEYLIHRVTPDGKLCIAGQIDLLVKKGNHITIGDWKGLPLDTPILTDQGWSTMEKIKVGDKVFDKDGNLCHITVKSEIHYNPCYKIKLGKDFEVTADCDHKWLVYFKTHPNTKYHGKPREVIMTTREIYNLMESLTPAQKQNGYNAPKIAIAKPLNLNEVDLPLDPYILGLWLGDGDASCGKITQALDSKSWEYIKQHGFELSHNYEKGEGVRAETRVVYGLMPILRNLGVLNNKHIPDLYMTASYNQRLNLLRGLMDSDGYYDHVHKQFCTRVNQKWQAEGVLALVSSLGVKATYNIFKVANGYKPATSYDIKFITSEFNAFMCRNQDIELKNNRQNYWSIIKVTPTETVPTQCIAVDSPTHTYLCTRHLLITHNTNKEIKTKSYFDSNTKKQVMMKYPLNNLQECNYSHYDLQLSTYAWMLQKLNPDFIIDDLVLVHFDHNDNMTVYHMPYLKTEVEKMLAFYKKQAQLEESARKRKRIEY